MIIINNTTNLVNVLVVNNVISFTVLNKQATTFAKVSTAKHFISIADIIISTILEQWIVQICRRRQADRSFALKFLISSDKTAVL